jgi:plastocyanin
MSWFRPSNVALGLAFFTSLTAAANIEVTVGKDSKLEFNPPSLKAQIGDTITYKFFSKVSLKVRTRLG